MREQQIQSKKIKQLEDQGYYVIKLINTNKNGIPDLIAIPKNSDVLFVEVKGPKGKLSKLQEYRIKELNQHGIKTQICRDLNQTPQDQKCTT
jgi:Holliday junction resolvase